ncbi:hypothetical protein ACEN8I_12200 [Polaromonas sp. CT11-55]|uniref:hypothetical protein n=1 Tax=Polaromonas sp. CT11-55 TaxID=3243045 RepID=UPI0039A64FFF
MSHVSMGTNDYPRTKAFTSAVLGRLEAKALELGGQGDGASGPRELYGPQYYGAFVRDLDGHKIEAMFWDEAAGG